MKSDQFNKIQRQRHMMCCVLIKGQKNKQKEDFNSSLDSSKEFFETILNSSRKNIQEIKYNEITDGHV